MNIKKLLPVTVLLATLTLVGCNNGGTSSSSPSTESSSSSESKSSSVAPSSSSSMEKPKSVTFDFWHTFGQGIEEGVQGYADLFEAIVLEEEGVEVTVNLGHQGSYNEILTKITSGIGTGNSPTLAVAYPDHVAQYIANESTPGQFVVNLEDFMDDQTIGFGKESYLGDTEGSFVYDKEDIIPSYFEEGSSYVNEGIYSMPLMKSTEVMMYNFGVVQKALIKLFPSAGYSAKDKVIKYMDGISWDKLLEIAQCIIDNKVAFSVPDMEYPVFYDSDSNLFISSMYQQEIPYSSVGEDKKGRIDFDYSTQPENFNKAKGLVDYFTKAHTDGLLTTKGTEGQYGSYSFTDEKCAITIGSSGGAGYNAPKTSTQYTIQVAKPPVLNDNPLYVNQGVTLTMLNNVSLSKEDNYWKQYYAWKFMKFLTNPNVNAVLCIEDSQGYVPVRYSAYTTPEFLEWLDLPEDIMIQSAKVVMEMNEEEAYYTAKSFSGASQLRDQCGGVITTVFLDVEKPARETTTEAVLKQAIDVAKTHF